MQITDIHDLYEFNYWANNRIMGVVETLTGEQYKRDLRSSHEGIHGTIVHIMGAEQIWLKRWKGESLGGLYKADEFATFESVRDRWSIVEHEMMGFCHMLTSDDDIAKIITYRDLKGNAFSQPLHQMMQHLVNHSSYHRGQVVTMLRQLDVKPVGTDLITFYRERRS